MNAPFHPDHEHSAAAREYQEYVQRELEPYGVGQVPGHVGGEKFYAYKRKTDALIKRQFLPRTHELWNVNFTGPNRIPTEALKPFEDQLIAACKVEAYNPATVPLGELRQITKRDSNGQKIHEFVGQESFVKQFSRPGRLAKIRSPDTHPGWFPKEVPSAWMKGR